MVIVKLKFTLGRKEVILKTDTQGTVSGQKYTFNNVSKKTPDYLISRYSILTDIELNQKRNGASFTTPKLASLARGRCAKYAILSACH